MRTQLRVGLVPVLLLALLPACKSRAKMQAPTPTPTPESVEFEGTSKSAAGEESVTPAQAEASPTPIQMDEAGLKKYIAYRTELLTFIKGERQKMEQLGKNEKEGSLSQLKGLADLQGEIDKGTQSLRAKYGYSEEQDRETFDAINEINASAVTKNPAIAASMTELKKAAAGTGPGADNAKQALEEMEDSEKKALGEARTKYGDAFVDLVLAHQPELAKLQADSIAAAFGK